MFIVYYNCYIVSNFDLVYNYGDKISYIYFNNVYMNVHSFYYLNNKLFNVKAKRFNCLRITIKFT